LNSLKLTEKPSFGAQIKIRLSKLFSHPSLVIGSLLVIVLSYLVLAPIVSILSNSIRLTRMETKKITARKIKNKKHEKN
jgi:hypothetical protein